MRLNVNSKCFSTKLALLGVIILSLMGCHAYSPVKENSFIAMTERTLSGCKLDVEAEDWFTLFLLSPEARAESLNRLEAPENEQQIAERAMLLTHRSASYRELREAEDLILNQLPLDDEAGCEADQVIEYVLNVNQMLQKQKSALVLLQRQVNEQSKTIEKQNAENAELDKKIEALTNIEHRMKIRANTVETEVSQ